MCYVFLRRRLCNVKSKPRRWQKYLEHFRNLLFIVIILILVMIYNIKRKHEDAVFSDIPAGSRRFIFTETRTNRQPIDRDYIKQMIDKYNSQEIILNIDTYGSVTENTVIMVVLVGKFSSSFRYFVTSLSQTKGIDNVLIIFSHSYFDENINTLIRSIDFCRTLQVFFPHSVQLYPHEFPGFHKGDCPKDIDIKSAQVVNCTGAYYPDIHGHYRNPYLVEIKHHWWWTANKVFENLTCTINHKGIVIFLDRYYFFIEDFLYMVFYMKKIMDSLPRCEFMSLGENSVLDVQGGSMYGVEVNNWNPKEHSGVLAFDYSVWNSIVSHYDLYCYIDDYSWSRSLYYISLNRREGKSFKVVYSLMPRAFKIVTGSYSIINDFEIIENMFKIMDLGKIIDKELAPVFLEVYYNVNLEDEKYLEFDYSENNGGWNDPRDKDMCSKITARKIKKIILEMNNEFQDYVPEYYNTNNYSGFFCNLIFLSWSLFFTYEMI